MIDDELHPTTVWRTCHAEDDSWGYLFDDLELAKTHAARSYLSEVGKHQGMNLSALEWEDYPGTFYLWCNGDDTAVSIRSEILFTRR